MPTVYFIRHGSTEANQKGLTRSWGKFGLDSAGVLAAKKIAETLADKGIGKIHSSDLARARQTAEPVAAATGAKVEYSPDLRTWNLGTLSGKKIGAVIPQLNFHSAKPHVPTPGGESYKQFFERSLAAFRKAIGGLKEKEAIAIIGHGRHMNGLDALMQAVQGKNVEISKIPVKGGPGPGAVVKLTFKGDTVKRETIIPGADVKGAQS